MKLGLHKKRIYLDYASLTPIDPSVLREMNKYSSITYANPSSWYKEGVSAKNAMSDARKSIANLLRAHADEIFFTSGGTESNSLAIDGCARAYLMSQAKSGWKQGDPRAHLIISVIEHSSVQETANMLAKFGVEVTRIGVDKDGIVNLDELKKSIRPNTFLVSIMTVNNETGAVQPIREIAKTIRQARAKFVTQTQSGASSQYPLFHTDAAQGALYEDLNMEQLGVDMMTLDGSKIYGPRGVGMLYIKRNMLNGDVPMIDPIIYGGGQEKGLRSGTENLPAIMGFAKAVEMTFESRAKESVRVGELKVVFLEGLKKIRPDLKVNGVSPDAPSVASNFINSSPHILNVSIPNIDNEFLLFQLDAQGVACSTKSSCLRDEEESYVLKSMGVESKSSLRFSFGRWTKKGDIKRALKKIGPLLSSVLDTQLTN